MASFRLHRPQTLGEAVRLLEEHGAQAKLLAGGSDLVVNMRMRIETPAHVIDLSRLDELRAIEFDPERGLRIGALVRLNELAEDDLIRLRFPVIASAASQVAGPNIRNMGTVGGNLCLDTRCVYYNQSYFWRKANGFCLKKDGAICHVAPGGKRCWAAYSGDLAPALLALDAAIDIAGPRGERSVKLAQFFVNDGIKKYELASDEIVCGVRVAPEFADWRGVYLKYRVRSSVDYPLAGVAVAARVREDGLCDDVRVAITAVNPSPRLVDGVRELVIGQTLSAETLEQVAELVRRTAKPLRTTVAASTSYRRHIVGVLAKRGLIETLKAQR
ncbi:FAD binding domain-containing protein [Pyrinomonas sp.]|uniref:FAD binding domain-containing protein n=1 Tax=Pyrinomonas sp. TaxID=2080306 RepID=UPI00332C7D8E